MYSVCGLKGPWQWQPRVSWHQWHSDPNKGELQVHQLNTETKNKHTNYNLKKNPNIYIVSQHSSCISDGFLVADVAVCFCRYWPTEWTCPMDRWEASCAAAPDRHCLPASLCVTQIFTPPRASTCCTTPSIIFSWLHQSWSVFSLTYTANKHTIEHIILNPVILPSYPFRCLMSQRLTLLRQISPTILSRRPSTKVVINVRQFSLSFLNSETKTASKISSLVWC